LRRGGPSVGRFGGPRASRGATASPGRPERWGGWGAPRVEGRHGFAGATRALGGLGGPARRGAPRLRRGDPSVWGGWGARAGGRGGAGGGGGPARRGAPRLRRGDPRVWGVWGALRGPPCTKSPGGCGERGRPWPRRSRA